MQLYLTIPVIVYIVVSSCCQPAHNEGSTDYKNKIKGKKLLNLEKFYKKVQVGNDQEKGN